MSYSYFIDSKKQKAAKEHQRLLDEATEAKRVIAEAAELNRKKLEDQAEAEAEANRLEAVKPKRGKFIY